MQDFKQGSGKSDIFTLSASKERRLDGEVGGPLGGSDCHVDKR